MYLQIENEFKENSRIRSSQILFIVGAILFVLINSSFLDQIRASNFTNEYYLFVLLGDTFLFYFIWCTDSSSVSLSLKRRDTHQSAQRATTT